MLNTNPAKRGVENPQRPRFEQRPFETLAELHRLAGRIGPRYGPLVMFAAATGLRPGERLALEHRDIDHQARVVYVRRALRNGRIKNPKTDGSIRAVPLQATALAALEQLPTTPHSPLVFPAPRGGYLDLHNFRYRDWKPAQRAIGIDPLRRIYDLRHTFATFALRAGVSTFDLSRYIGASLTMIDRHYGHLAKDGRQHAINLLDTFTAAAHRRPPAWTLWTSGGRRTDATLAIPLQQTHPKQGETPKPSDGLEPSTPSLPSEFHACLESPGLTRVRVDRR